MSDIRNTKNYDNIHGNNSYTFYEGDKAPPFKLETHKNKYIGLSDFKGHFLILYFYPKDNTSGCTTQAIDFNDNLTKFEKLNCKILGISKDTITSHHKFSEKYNLQFPLASDVDLSVCNKYQVYKEKNMYGKKVMGVERSTFLIDPDGKIIKIWRKVSVKDHVTKVYEELKKLTNI